MCILFGHRKKEWDITDNGAHNAYDYESLISLRIDVNTGRRTATAVFVESIQP